MKYTIMDGQTGKAVTIEADRPPTKTEQEQVFQQAGLRGKSPETQNTGGLGNILKGTAKTFFPRTSNYITQEPQKLLESGQTRPTDLVGGVTHDIGTLANLFNTGAGAAGELGSYALPFMGSAGMAAKLGLSGLLHGVTNPEANLGNRVTQGTLEGSLGVLLGNLSKFLPYLTKGGVSKLATKGAESGADIPFLNAENSVSSLATKKAASEYAGVPEVQKAVQSRLTAITPPMDESGNAFLSSPQALEIRRGLQKAYGPSILDWFTGLTPERQAAGVVRNTLSELLHQYAPATQLPDKAYSLYSKGGALGGSPLSLLLKYGGLGLGNTILGNPAGKILKAVEHL